MNTTVTDNKFADLKAKLRELFELDKSDLDFGIYRIMAAKNKEVNEFLDRQLKDVVRQMLAAHGADAAGQVQEKLDTAIQQAHTLGADPDTLPKVKELKAKLAAAGGTSASELEADIYNHLLAFFSRYYDEGDFISKRRYKGDTYAIPYNGEEVTLYWANKDQYYIKSGEWHKDYRFKAGGKTVHFKLVEATQETNNNKEPDDAKRRYILAAETPVESTETELTLRFEFRAPTEAEKQAVIEATRIFGGNYDKASGRTKGDEREQFCAAAEQRALAAMPEDWKRVVATPTPTETKPLRTLLGKQLDHFTARNTFDYFIHKDLGGFLKRELDFYIKNEVVRLDDLESLPADHLAKVQGKVKAIRTVAGRIIDLLASIENFQKKMWLKKKFVLETNWLITVDRIPAHLRNTVAANPKQWDEWEKLGFKPADGEATLLNGPKWGTREYLDANDKLVVDTGLFQAGFPAFRAGLLASGVAAGGQNGLDDATSGLLIHSENFQALNLLQWRYREQVKCTYIDPPYNSKTTKILYKNTFEHSSWLCLMDSRLAGGVALEASDGSHVVAIDENEHEVLGRLLSARFPKHEKVCVAVVHNKKGTQGDYFSYTHEYAFFCIAPGRDATHGGAIPEEKWEYDNLRKWGRESKRETARNCFYPIYVADGEIVGLGEVCPEGFHPGTANLKQGSRIAVYPVDTQGVERKWRYARNTFEGIRKLLKVHATASGEVQVLKARSEAPLKTVWDSSRYIAGDFGTRWLSDLGIKVNETLYPKSLHTVEDSIAALTETGATVLDYFGGSGTTGHAVINLNREDGGDRKFILIEMAAYFHTVLKPRITKVLYSPEWKDGKAKVHGQGTSALVKYFALESYEDALNNLPAPTGDLLAQADPATRDAFITYSLDLELGPNLLNMDAFRDPWGYHIKAQPAGAAEIKPHRVDMVETFNYLLGLKVKAYGPIERYTATFERAEHADNLGRLKITGRLRRDQDGPFVFQRVEGELLDGTRVLVVWRKLGDDAEQDAAVLEAWMNRHREETKERSEHRDYHLIYINGPVTLPQPTAEIRTVLPIEQTFKDRMFEDEKDQ